MPQTFQGRTRTCRAHHDQPHRLRGHQLLYPHHPGQGEGPAACLLPLSCRPQGVRWRPGRPGPEPLCPRGKQRLMRGGSGHGGKRGSEGVRAERLPWAVSTAFPRSKTVVSSPGSAPSEAGADHRADGRPTQTRLLFPGVARLTSHLLPPPSLHLP